MEDDPIASPGVYVVLERVLDEGEVPPVIVLDTLAEAERYARVRGAGDADIAQLRAGETLTLGEPTEEANQFIIYPEVRSGLPKWMRPQGAARRKRKTLRRRRIA
jgi:hypothetical protein